MRRVLCLALIALVLSCDDPDFGDRIYDFVSANGKRISSEHVDADLPLRWYGAHEAAAMGLQARSLFIKEWLGRVVIPQMGASQTEQLVVVQNELLDLTRMEGELDTLDEGVKYWEGSCESRDLYESLRISRVSTAAPVQPNVDPNYYIEGNTCWPCALADFVGTNYTALKVDEQNRRAASALELFYSLAIDGAEVFKRSTKICKDAATDFAEIRQAIHKESDAMRTTLTAARVALTHTKLEIEAQLVPADLDAYLRRSGLQRSLLLLERRRHNEDIVANLISADIELVQVSKASQQETSCESLMAAEEHREDTLRLLVAQADALLVEQDSLELDVVHRLVAHRSSWLKSLAELTSSSMSQSHRGCRLKKT